MIRGSVDDRHLAQPGQRTLGDSSECLDRNAGELPDDDVPIDVVGPSVEAKDQITGSNLQDRCGSLEGKQMSVSVPEQRERRSIADASNGY